MSTGSQRGGVRRFCFAWVAPLLLLVVSGDLQADDSTQLLQTDDFNLTARLAAEKHRVMAGEPIWLHYEVRNVGDEDWQVHDSLAVTAAGRKTAFDVQVVRDDVGARLPLPNTGPVVGGMIISASLKAEEVYRKSLFLPHWAVLEQPGTYTVTCRRTLVLQGHGHPREVRFDGTHSVPTVLSVQLEVVPYDADAMARVIEHHAKEILSGEDPDARHRALRSLQAIHDERTVSWWCRALETGDSHRMYEAASALGAYASDLALEGLHRASRVQAKDIRSGNTDDPAAGAGAVRSACALSLGRCGHPRALDLLVDMRTDPRESVRLRVVRALEEHPGRKATEALTELTKDASSRVQERAADVLRRRGSNR